MPSVRERVLQALRNCLADSLAATVRRNEVLPEKVPSAGLVILRDGDPGEPDVTLNPRTEFYSHRVEIEVYTPRDATGGGEAALDALLGSIGVALQIDPSLGGLAENLIPSAPETGALAVKSENCWKIRLGDHLLSADYQGRSRSGSRDRARHVWPAAAVVRRR
jgi:hypothetical protein